MNNKPIEIILAATPKGEIGYKNTIPWRLKGDLKRFKDITMGNILLMGKNTFESLPGPLEGRTVIVISKSLFRTHGSMILDHREIHHHRVLYATNLGHAMRIANELPIGNTIFIAGGVRLYENFLEWPAVKVHLTTVYKEAAAGYDAVIPNFNVLDKFEVVGEPIEVYDTVKTTAPAEPIPAECMGDICIPCVPAETTESVLSHAYTTLVSPMYHRLP